ncbi:MAG: hypothetical protein J5685_04260 [Clostridiales bacterium]|nr:hypothetical protein [Clostridiales bacterium]
MSDFREGQSNFMQLDHMARVRDIGLKMMILFYLAIADVLITFFTGLTAIDDLIHVGSGERLVDKLVILFVVASVLSFAVSLAYSIVTIRLCKYGTPFLVSGIFYLLFSICNLLDMYLDTGWIGIISSVCGILYIFKFSEAMRENLQNVDFVVSSGWDRLRTFYFIVLGIAGIALICNIFLPLMTDVFLLVYGACMIGELIVSIWTVILLYKSYKAMVDYTPR